MPSEGSGPAETEAPRDPDLPSSPPSSSPSSPSPLSDGPTPVAVQAALAAARLRSAWDAETLPHVRRALVAAGFAALLVGAHVARRGTPLARGAVGLVLGLLALFALARALRKVRRRSVRHVVEDVVTPADPALGERTLRALGLAERAAHDPDVGSAELAGLHLERLLGRASPERIAERASRTGRMAAGIALGLAAAGLAAAAVAPFRVVEGLDVLAARGGVAPLALDWVDEVEIVAQPPAYLHLPREPVFAFSPAELPRGTVLTVSARPLRPGRALVLSDGVTEVPFVDDGASRVVAHFTLMDDARLFVAARFGAVAIRQRDVQEATAIPDAAPTVAVEGAPRSLKLLDEPSIPVHYEAKDDHGLREVALVLRSGQREERRVLSKPQEAKLDRGGYELRPTDPFFKKAYLPVEVRVEARDNDPVAGPKWGKSAPITVIVPQVGEAEARRYAGLAKLRDALVDLLAFRMDPPDKDGSVHEKAEAEAQTRASKALLSALAETHGGLRVPGRLSRIVRGQWRRVTEAREAERKLPGEKRHEALVRVTEDSVLALDSALRGLGRRDTQLVAKRLAEVADEAAAAAALGEQAGKPRLDAAVTVLAGGGEQLLRLGDLGLDLGEIVQNGLRRIARAREARDAHHAELAARDLAARLRRPEPSFGGGGRGGTESGGGAPRTPGDAEAGGEGMDEFGASDAELEQLAKEHAGEMSEVENALAEATDPEAIEALREEAKRRAEAIREAIKNLPPRAEDGETAQGAAAEARRQAEAMAGALDRGDPKDAVARGQASRQSLGEAKRRGEENAGYYAEERAGREAQKADEIIARELAWAEEALENLRRAASDRARPRLERSAKREQSLADKAREIGEKGQGGKQSLPEDVLDKLSEAEAAMRDARAALEKGDGETGLRRQEEAQRLLEMARGEPEKQEGDPSNPEEGGSRGLAKDTEIPDEKKHKGPEEFRRRVLEGLRKTDDPVLRRAIKRYAEGLLR